ncbi:hypothetical protein PIB30_043021 [Stylosanthes scabra]|uniref:Uncharacterized protein n=1 Tax=Stylosanthes scabra TaxID=79078 RepID=A0ABU6WDI0_9FABA|nr:hypothetical protein [Stylosanthes scabra]
MAWADTIHSRSVPTGFLRRLLGAEVIDGSTVDSSSLNFPAVRRVDNQEPPVSRRYNGLMKRRVSKPLIFYISDGQADNKGLKRFRFARGDEANIRKAWEIMAAKRHRGMMHNIREKGAPHHWISDGIFRRYLDFWASADYQAMRRANKSNRASSTSGSLHTRGGSITYPAIAKKMSEVILRTHTRKNDRGQFVDERSKQQIEQHKAEIKRLEDERAARIVASDPAGPPRDEDEVWVRIAGGRKRGRVYEKGKVPKRPAPRLVDLEDASTCSGPDAREHITLMNREIQQQAETYK